MTIDVKLAEHTRAALEGAGAVREIKMFGGIGFMLNGNMLAGTSDRGLLVRVGADAEAEALKRPGARLMVMRGRAMNGYVQVGPERLDARTVKALVKMAQAYVSTLPAKKTKQVAKKAARKKRAKRA